MTYADTSTFGRIIDANAVETAVRDTLERWLPTYIAELERQYPKVGASGWEVGELNTQVWYHAAHQFDRFREDNLPAIIVICPGLTDRPVRDADGIHLCTFGLAVGVVAGAIDREETDAAVKAYGAAVRACLLQQSSLGALGADGITWLGETYDELPFEDSRSLVGGRLTFTVQVDDVVTKLAGPLQPSDPPADIYDPPEPTGTVESHHITVTPTNDELED